ncbi:hypothetical protein SBOR_5613 [Sclerotinia borealis F-4128]|uniref:Uncharacterized protein n=1 Tax=Sclerotinia borealis (strain F-4128) TaxID=1432307 RepID=W9CDQ8_SCLBF|nr:hypothetical protein SBOR_5613 [Sclerotinia borealis F-4128]
MGLKRLDQSNWLTIDPTYLPEHTLRASLLDTQRPCVLQVLPPAIPATHELLELVVEFLLQRYPTDFTLVLPDFSAADGKPSEPKIFNRLTNETHIIGPTCAHPLEIAARLCMEDFNILLRDPSEGVDAVWKLQASATLFPAGWKLQERIGCSMAVLHGPVPGWNEKLGKSVERYFTHLGVRSCMERANLFVQRGGGLFQDGGEEKVDKDKEGDGEGKLCVKDIYVRRERQTFMRLERSGAVLFTVRTYMERLVDMKGEEAGNLARQVRGWGEEVKGYKGVGVWGGVVLGWCDGVGERERVRVGEEDREREREEEILRGLSLRRDSGIDMGDEEEREGEGEEEEECKNNN